MQGYGAQCFLAQLGREQRRVSGQRTGSEQSYDALEVTSREDAEGRPPLAVGLFVEAEIVGPEAHDVIVVPRYAMRGDSTILIVDAENRLHTKRVQVLRIDRDDVLVQGPLAEGERICVSPIQVVVEGMAVRAVEDQANQASKTRSS